MTNTAHPLPIVVGLDPSEHAAPALRWAAAKAERTGVPLRLVHAVPSSAYLASSSLGLVPVWQDQAADEQHDVEERTLQQWLDREAQALTTERGLIVETHLVTGSPGAVMVEESASASALVLGSRGRGAFAGTVLGSTAQQVAGHARCPVVVVRHDPAPTARGVVVGVDDSDAGRRAIDAAYTEARSRHAPLTLVHAWSPSYTGTLAPSYQAFDATVEGDRREGEHVLAVAVQELAARGEGVEVTTALTQRPPGQALVEASASAELVVVGSRGRGGFAGLVLGSVSSTVLHHAACPVMVVA
jgi:nucleotide-binding universal stress UspA family protein